MTQCVGIVLRNLVEKPEMDETAQMSTTYKHESFICSFVLGIILSLILSMKTHFHLIPFLHAERMICATCL